MKVSDTQCFKGHDLTKFMRFKRKKVRGNAVTEVKVPYCYMCHRGYCERYEERKKAGIVGTAPKALTFAERLARMKRQGEDELNKARKEGIVK